MKFILTLVIALAVGQLAYAGYGGYGSESKYGFYLDKKTKKIFP